MSYTIKCPDPECKTTFELEEADFDAIYEDDDTIECSGCEVEWEWEYDNAKPDGEEITLTKPAEYEEDDEEDEGDADNEQ